MRRHKTPHERFFRCSVVDNFQIWNSESPCRSPFVRTMIIRRRPSSCSASAAIPTPSTAAVRVRRPARDGLRADAGSPRCCAPCRPRIVSDVPHCAPSSPTTPSAGLPCCSISSPAGRKSAVAGAGPHPARSVRCMPGEAAPRLVDPPHVPHIPRLQACPGHKPAGHREHSRHGTASTLFAAGPNGRRLPSRAERARAMTGSRKAPLSPQPRPQVLSSFRAWMLYEAP